jgi:hypothetical protein
MSNKPLLLKMLETGASQFDFTKQRAFEERISELEERVKQLEIWALATEDRMKANK